MFPTSISELDRVVAALENLTNDASWYRYTGYTDDTLGIARFKANTDIVFRAFKVKSPVSLHPLAEDS